MTPEIPLGIRQNNPLNIRNSGTKWNGMIEPDPAFCTFTDPVMGIRAAAKTLLTYQRKHSLRTVRSMIDRWAPPVENDTASYVKHVAGAMGIEPDAPVDLAGNPIMFAAMIETMIRHENGQQPYLADVIVRGIDLALGVNAVPHLGKVS